MYNIHNNEGADTMNWNDSQMVSSAIAQGQGGMSLGEQWALAAMLRDDDDNNAQTPGNKHIVKPAKHGKKP